MRTCFKVENPSYEPFSDIIFEHNLPEGSEFIPGSFTVNGEAKIPCLCCNAGVISWCIPTLEGREVVDICFEVRPRLLIGGTPALDMHDEQGDCCDYSKTRHR